MKKFHLSLQGKFLLSIALIILPTLGAIFLWAGIQQEKQAMGQVMNQAKVLVRQIILTRQWVSDSGGLMVRRDSKGASDMVYFFDDRIETPQGSFQRFTPAMVTKKLSQYSLQQDLYRFRVTGANPLNPENVPDAFEQKALEQFAEEGLLEVSRTRAEDGKTYFQYMVPLLVDSSCLECHQGFSKGAVGGGLSVFLPIDNVKSSLARDHFNLAVSGVVLILLTTSTLFILLRLMVIRPLSALKEMTGRISDGDLDARVHIPSGDEFAQLGQAFNCMAVRLSRSREVQEERIQQATRELAEANRELQSLDKLKSDFLANMSHELRSPLTVLRGGVDFLKRTIHGPESESYLAIIDKNLSRLIHLVSDLFDFTKIEAGKIEWAFQRENVSGLVQDVIEITSPLAGDKYMSVSYDSPGEIFAEIDIERIEQVLVNLIENAIKFSDPGTEITVKVCEDGESVCVSIQDQGAGISRENLEVIFEKFHTLPSSESKNRWSGTGLGLAICKGIVEGHGGRIWATSTKGEGSVFSFSLPK